MDSVLRLKMSFMKLNMASPAFFEKSWWSSFWVAKDNFIGIQSISKRGEKRETMELFSLDVTYVSGNLPKSFP